VIAFENGKPELISNFCVVFVLFLLHTNYNNLSLGRCQVDFQNPGSNVFCVDNFCKSLEESIQ
jgi:hypothetical protein